MTEELERMTRAELDARAAELGIADAAQLPTKAAVADAIRAAGTTPLTASPSPKSRTAAAAHRVLPPRRRRTRGR